MKQNNAPQIDPASVEHHPNIEAIERHELDLIAKLWEPQEGTPKEMVENLHVILKDIEKTQVVKNNLIQVAYVKAQQKAEQSQTGLILPRNGLSSVN